MYDYTRNEAIDILIEVAFSVLNGEAVAQTDDEISSAIACIRETDI